LKADPKPYEWDFDGACAPGAEWSGRESFSVGIFQWVPKAGGEGVKRSKVIRRIKGGTSEAETRRVFAEARVAVDRLNALGATDGDFA
jgi:hypothetical protein